MTEPKRTEPSWSLTWRNDLYTHSTKTDIRATFARIRAEQQAAQTLNVSPIKRKASK